MDVAQAIEVLNRIHKADPSVLPSLILQRVPCNSTLAADPTVQVGWSEEKEVWEVGLLGIINGIFGVQGEDRHGFIEAVFDDELELTHFKLHEV